MWSIKLPIFFVNTFSDTYFYNGNFVHRRTIAAHCITTKQNHKNILFFITYSKSMLIYINSTNLYIISTSTPTSKSEIKTSSIFYLWMPPDLLPLPQLKIYKINGFILIDPHTLKHQLVMVEIILFRFETI